MNKLFFRRFVAFTMLATATSTTVGSAQIVDFVETFENGSAFFANAEDQAVQLFTTGGVDNSAFIRATTNPDFQGTVVRAETGASNPLGDASGGAFAGDYVAAEVESISFAVRHDATEDIDFNLRFARANNFPGANFSVGTIAASTEFEVLTVDITDPDLFGPEGPFSFEDVFGGAGIANIQISVSASDTVFNVDVDNFTIATAPAAVPEPSSLMVVVLSALGLCSRRRRN